MSYKNPTPVVVGLIRHQVPNPNWDSAHTLKLVAIERGTPPFINGFAFPGGYVDEGETAEIAIAREVQEEMQFATLPHFWKPLTTRITEANRLLIFMLYTHVVGTTHGDFAFTPTKEAVSFKLVRYGDPLCFPLHQEILNRTALWLN